MEDQPKYDDLYVTEVSDQDAITSDTTNYKLEYEKTLRTLESVEFQVEQMRMQYNEELKRMQYELKKQQLIVINYQNYIAEKKKTLANLLSGTLGVLQLDDMAIMPSDKDIQEEIDNGI